MSKLKLLKSLQLRILLVIFIFLFVPIAILLNYNFVKTETVLQEKTSRLVLGNLEQIGNKLDNATEDIMKISSMISSNSVILSGLSGYGHKKIDDFETKGILSLDSNDIIKKSKIQKEINYVKNNFFNYKMHVFLFGADGIVYCSLDTVYDDLAFSLEYSRKYREQDWYKTLETNETVGTWTAPFSYNIDSDNGKRYISLARMIKNYNTQDILGVIMVNFSEDNFKEFLGDSVNGTVILLNDNKQTIFSNGAEEMDGSQFDEMVLKKLPEDGIGYFSTELSGKKYLVNYYSIRGLDWFLVSLMSYDDVMKDITKLRANSFTINSVIFITFFMIALVMLFRLTYPLKRLIFKIRRMKIGDHVVGMKNMEYSDDVSGIVNSFEYMIKRVGELVETIIAEQQYENELKYDTLRAQINPHFLFNTLNTIKWSAMMSGSQNVANMISALGKLLEVSMNKGDDEITLGEELELTKSYIYIENIKHNGELKLTYDQAQWTEHYKILKLILQPIVENSIIHGLKNRPGGEISLSAEIKENKLLVKVKDNGSGISKEKIDQILDSGHDQGRHKYSSIGLINIHERLRIKYGADYGLFIESEENKGTVVSITLPVIKNDFIGGQAIDESIDC